MHGHECMVCTGKCMVLLTSYQVKDLECEAVRGDGVRERWEGEVREISNRLNSSEVKRSDLISQLEAALKGLDNAEEEKQALLVCLKILYLYQPISSSA